MKILALVCTILLVPVFAFAQLLGPCRSLLVPVTISVHSEISSTVPSASVGFEVEMRNAGAQIISDASLAVEIAEKHTGTIVGRFVVSEKVGIFPESSSKTSFAWKVPLGLNEGEYVISVIFAPKDAKRAAVFSQVYPTAKTDLNVTSESTRAISIKELAVNGVVYAPHTVASVSKGGNVQASVQAENSLSGPYKGLVVWNVYASDAKLADEPIASEDFKVLMHPQMPLTFSYTIPASDANSYYVEGQFRDGNGPVFFDMLIGDGAFPWIGCAPTSKSNGTSSQSGNTLLVSSIIIAIIGLGLAEELIRRKRV